MLNNLIAIEKLSTFAKGELKKPIEGMIDAFDKNDIDVFVSHHNVFEVSVKGAGLTEKQRQLAENAADVLFSSLLESRPFQF